MVWKDLCLIEVLHQLDLVWRLAKWVIELSKFEVSFEEMKALKAQLFTDFLAEMTLMPLQPDHTWVAFMDDSSNSMGSVVGLIL